MKTFTLEDYKKAIRAKYEEEKNGIYASFLFKPSRAQLRKLCWEIFKDNNSQDDLKSFSHFFDFEFTVKNKLIAETSRFRRIEDFFKGKSDLSEMQAVEIAAILVNFQPRPFLNYLRKLNKGEVTTKEISEGEYEVIPPAEEFVIYQHIYKELEGQDFNQSDSISSAKNDEMISILDVKSNNTPLKKWWIYLLVVVGIGGSVFAVKDSFFGLKECMEWREDHYEDVDCESEVQEIGKINTKVPMDEHQFKLKKIKVTDTTTFFVNGDPVVWYDKSDNEVIFFNRPGYNPEKREKKYLKPITGTIIRNHIK